MSSVPVFLTQLGVFRLLGLFFLTWASFMLFLSVLPFQGPALLEWTYYVMRDYRHLQNAQVYPPEEASSSSSLRLCLTQDPFPCRALNDLPNTFASLRVGDSVYVYAPVHKPWKRLEITLGTPFYLLLGILPLMFCFWWGWRMILSFNVAREGRVSPYEMKRRLMRGVYKNKGPR
jgi:hypothetical protein